ncbi:hypothetical protein GCM10018790_73260 [Kitasatospora xanthocidica]|uniref:hypothetical protein n=1 Tax=Kitasatospora xanthocidica TaxID=83382 RepID=UPI00167B8899|nr:hypothetical protein [Kitasatospora xanthocidica]GHF85007.1 hypothetical protein GCM10018790_73260 [Kitasatospora xanthocidica]
MTTEDGFEEELAVRLGARAARVGAGAPVAELRVAGRRRLRRTVAVRGAAAVAVLALGAGVLTQLGGGGSAALGPAAAPSRTPSPTPSDGRLVQRGAENDILVTRVLSCPGGSFASAVPIGLETPQPELSAAGQTVEHIVRDGYDDHYFSTCRDTETNTLIVRRNPGPTGLDAAVAQALAPWPAVKVKFVDTPSYPSLLTLAREIRAEAGDWSATYKVKIVNVEIAVDGTGVIIHTPQAETAREQLIKQYGHLVSVGL